MVGFVHISEPSFHFHLMPWNSSSKLIWISDFVRQPGNIESNTLRKRKWKKKYCMWAMAYIARQNILCTRVKDQQVLAFRGVWLKFRFDAHRINRLYFCTPIRMFVTFSFFLVLEATCIYFSFPTFRYRYCVIYFRGSRHRNFSNIIPNRHINCRFCESPTSTTATHNV